MHKKFFNTLKEILKAKIVGIHHEPQSHFENLLDIINLNLKNYHPHNLLDVGCGLGDRTMRIAQFFKLDSKDVFGVDYNDKQVEICKKAFNAKKIDLESQIFPYEKKIFGLVVCNQVLEHVKNYEKVIDQIIRVTKDGGYIILGIPNLAHLINRIYLLFGFQPLCIRIGSSHVRGFTHSGFINMLNSIDTVELIDSKGSMMYPLPLFIGKFLSKYLTGASGFTCYLLRKI